MAKRYALVRVDGNGSCPSGTYDGCKVNLVCVLEKKRIKVTERNCQNCLYGDTKEQLIRKVAQVLLQRWLKRYLGEFTRPKLASEQIKIFEKNCLEQAKEIVEFLGVEE